MVEVATVAVGVFAVLALVLGVIWLARSDILDPSDDDESRDELRARQDSEDWTIPLRKRYKALPGPARILIIALTATAIAAAYALVQFFRTGAPADSFLNREVQYAIVGVVGVVGGIYVTRWFDRRAARVFVAYDSEDEDEVESIPYMKDSTRVRNGEKVIKELSKGRLLGLWWRYRQVGERRELRESNQSLPEDLIEHQIPRHAIELPTGDYVVSTRADGDIVLSGGANPDKSYQSKNQMSYEESVRLRERYRRMRTRLRAAEATKAELSNEVKRLRKMIENREYREREDLINDLDKVLSSFEGILEPAASTNGYRPGENNLRIPESEEAET